MATVTTLKIPDYLLTEPPKFEKLRVGKSFMFCTLRHFLVLDFYIKVYYLKNNRNNLQYEEFSINWFQQKHILGMSSEGVRKLAVISLRIFGTGIFLSHFILLLTLWDMYRSESRKQKITKSLKKSDLVYCKRSKSLQKYCLISFCNYCPFLIYERILKKKCNVIQKDMYYK